jgi:hypothetical protein
MTAPLKKAPPATSSKAVVSGAKKTFLRIPNAYASGARWHRPGSPRGFGGSQARGEHRARRRGHIPDLTEWRWEM